MGARPLHSADMVASIAGCGSNCFAKNRYAGFAKLRAATIADHIVPIAKGGAVHSSENLQPVCRECHQDKSNADKGHRVRPRIAADGWPE